MRLLSQQQRICRDCEKPFEALAYNQERCPACQAEYQRAHRPHAVKDDVAWINYYIDNNDWSINCPLCQRHMSLCQCADPTVKPFAPPAVETWRPWKMSLKNQ